MSRLLIFLLVRYFECLFGWCDAGEDIGKFVVLHRVEGIEIIEVSFNMHIEFNKFIGY